jgi:2-methylcitrate dehydratase PrpD
MIKKYPCCGGNHAMLDSLFSLMREHNFTYDDVVEAEVDQSFLSIVMLYEEPDDELKGKFSARYNVAAALVDGEVAIPTFSQEKIDDPQIQEAMGKVRNRVMAKAEEGLTDATQGLPIRIKLKDGRVVEHRTARANILGAQGNPWGFENIKNKFQVNAGLALPEDRVDTTIDAWTDITQVADLAETIQRTLVR